ncbi:MAG: hypothetical protein KTR15_09210, partial [Phycisphaeraceae bacterium]|nr:hypothetical protein [Phycisphaeraceae bacterium]
MTKLLPSSKAKRWTIQGLLAASAVGLGIAGVITQIDRGNPVEAAQAEPKDEPRGLSLVTYSQVEQLRQSNG